MSDDTIVKRPWGQYQKLYQECGVWVKRVELSPGERISLQTHQCRSEKWIVVSGEGVVTVNNYTVPVTHGSTVDIPCTTRHRIANTSTTPLIFIEVACGDNLTEDDIKRFDDDYSRDLV